MIEAPATGYDAGMETLLALAPVAALLAAFAYWIDRQNGRRIDDLRDMVSRRVDDLAAANREAHALIGQRIDAQGKRIDEQGKRIEEQGRQLAQRIDKQEERIEEQGRQLAQRIDEQGRQLAQRIDKQGENLRGDIDKQGENLRGDIGKLHALLLAIVPRAAAADDDAGVVRGSAVTPRSGRSRRAGKRE